MSEDKDTRAPPAFPSNYGPDGYGLTKREYFAAHAPISSADALRCYGGSTMPTDDAGRTAFMDTWAFLRFEYADAMILQGKESTS